MRRWGRRSRPTQNLPRQLQGRPGVDDSGPGPGLSLRRRGGAVGYYLSHDAWAEGEPSVLFVVHGPDEGGQAGDLGG